MKKAKLPQGFFDFSNLTIENVILHRINVRNTEGEYVRPTARRNFSISESEGLLRCRSV